MTFVEGWRRARSRTFDLGANSTARATVEVDLWGARRRVYANANLSLYSGRRCNARCGFCVEELRPASRGLRLDEQKRIERDDRRYFAALEEVLGALAPLAPSVSITGGEPSKDPRLPGVLAMLARHNARKRTVTTNGSGLLDERRGRRVIDWIVEGGVAHLNISVAHHDPGESARLMALPDALSLEGLRAAVERARRGGVRVRLSCVLLREGVRDLAGIARYLEFARSLGVDNVIFRQLMSPAESVQADDRVARYSAAQRVRLEPILDEISSSPAFSFQRQILGYYYYVEVWRHGELDVVFEEADLGQLERTKGDGVVHELVFHPDGTLASTWQPWDGVLGPPGFTGRPPPSIRARVRPAATRR